MFYYESLIGIFVIKRQNDKFVLIMNNVIYGQYISVEAAASDVYCHVTGCNEWDILDCQIDDVPSDISEWSYSKQPLTWCYPINWVLEWLLIR